MTSTSADKRLVQARVDSRSPDEFATINIAANLKGLMALVFELDGKTGSPDMTISFELVAKGRTARPGDRGHVYELKKMRMSMDKDGITVLLRLHHADNDSDLARQPVGAVFTGPLKFENYVEIP